MDLDPARPPRDDPGAAGDDDEVAGLPRFGATALVKITNGAVRAWVAEMLDAGLSPATVRKAVFALRQCLAAAIADGRLVINPALRRPAADREVQAGQVPVPGRGRAARRGDARPIPSLVLVGAYAGLRWGEAAGLTRAQRRRAPVAHPGDQYGGRGARSCDPRPGAQDAAVAADGAGRAIGHAPGRGSPGRYVDPDPDALVFTAPRGGPLCAVAVRPPRLAAGGGAGRSAGHHLPRPAAQLRRDPGRRRLQRPRGVGVGRSQQRRVHPHPLRRAVRGRLGCGRRPPGRPARWGRPASAEVVELRRTEES